MKIRHIGCCLLICILLVGCSSEEIKNLTVNAEESVQEETGLVYFEEDEEKDFVPDLEEKSEFNPDHIYSIGESMQIKESVLKINYDGYKDDIDNAECEYVLVFTGIEEGMIGDTTIDALCLNYQIQCISGEMVVPSSSFELFLDGQRSDDEYIYLYEDYCQYIWEDQYICAGEKRTGQVAIPKFILENVSQIEVQFDNGKVIGGVEKAKFILIENYQEVLYPDANKYLIKTIDDAEKLFCNEWIYSYDNDCILTIFRENEEIFNINITWTDSDDSWNEWNMHAKYNEKTQKLEYSDCTEDSWYWSESDSTYLSHRVYSDGSGELEIKKDGYLYWKDHVRGVGSNGYFAL